MWEIFYVTKIRIGKKNKKNQNWVVLISQVPVVLNSKYKWSNWKTKRAKFVLRARVPNSNVYSNIEPTEMDYDERESLEWLFFLHVFDMIASVAVIRLHAGHYPPCELISHWYVIYFLSTSRNANLLNLWIKYDPIEVENKYQYIYFFLFECYTRRVYDIFWIANGLLSIINHSQSLFISI